MYGQAESRAENKDTKRQDRTKCIGPVSILERATRIELATSAWEADVLPLNYARIRLPNYYPIKSDKSQVFCGKTDLKFCKDVYERYHKRLCRGPSP